LCCWSFYYARGWRYGTRSPAISLRLPNRLLARFARLRAHFGHDLINTWPQRGGSSAATDATASAVLRAVNKTAEAVRNSCWSAYTPLKQVLMTHQFVFRVLHFVPQRS